MFQWLAPKRRARITRPMIFSATTDPPSIELDDANPTNELLLSHKHSFQAVRMGVEPITFGAECDRRSSKRELPHQVARPDEGIYFKHRLIPHGANGRD